MAMREQKFDIHKEFLKQVVGHGGSYTDLFEIKLFSIAERIMAHLPPPHQLQHVPLKRYVILNKF